MLRLASGGISGIVSNLSRMLNEATEDMAVREFALTIVPAYGQDQISAVYEFVRSHIKYQPDPSERELFIAPRRMIEMIKSGNAAGDCDDQGLFCAAIYQTLGYRSHILLLDQEDQGWDHAACEVRSDKANMWIFIDTTSTQPKGIVPSYFKRLEVE